MVRGIQRIITQGFSYELVVPKRHDILLSKFITNKYHQKFWKIKLIIIFVNMKIYLDDMRVPSESDWTIVRNYDEFVSTINDVGLENVELISLDHDLDRTAMIEWSKNTFVNYKINYSNIEEKTGLDCAKWLIEQWGKGKPVVDVVVHSANAIGSANIMGIINHYRHVNRLPQNCVRVQIEHSIDQELNKKY